MIGRYYRTAAVAGALLVLSTAILAGCSATDSAGTTSEPPATAPDFTGATLDGLQVSLGEYRGKPLVLAFMASW